MFAEISAHIFAYIFFCFSYAAPMCENNTVDNDNDHINSNYDIIVTTTDLGASLTRASLPKSSPSCSVHTTPCMSQRQLKPIRPVSVQRNARN